MAYILIVCVEIFGIMANGRRWPDDILYAALDKTFFFDLLATVWCSPMTETAWNV